MITDKHNAPVTPTASYFTSYKFESSETQTANQLLKSAVDLWLSNTSSAISTYGHIISWDTSEITDMRELFKDETTFNHDISNWDVSNVTDMSDMFNGASSFNQDIGGWNVSNVTNMSNMFYGASSIDQLFITWNWNVNNVVNFTDMFNGATIMISDKHNAPVTPNKFYFTSYKYEDSETQTANDLLKTAVNLWVTNRSSAISTYGHISIWDTSEITDMSELFRDKTTFNDNISNWDVSNVQSMEKMFRNARVFNQDIGGWNVSNVTTMKQMFRDAYAFDQYIPLWYWNVNNVTDFNTMFRNARIMNSNKHNAPTTPTASYFTPWKPTTNAELKAAVNLWLSDTGTANYGHISIWNTSEITDMSELFKNKTTFNDDITMWNVSNVEYMYSMFYGATLFNQNLLNWDVSNVISMNHMFYGATSLDQAIPLWKWNVNEFTTFTDMFYGASIMLSDKYNAPETPTASYFTPWQPASKSELQLALDSWITDRS